MKPDCIAHVDSEERDEEQARARSRTWSKVQLGAKPEEVECRSTSLENLPVPGI
jgi:hypothetical protein